MASIRKIRLQDGAHRYVVSFRDDAGTSKEKRFRTKADAERFRTEVSDARSRGADVDPKAGRATFRTVAERWRTSAMHSPTTTPTVLNRLTKHVYPAIGDRQIGSLRHGDIQRLVTDLSAKLAASTVSTIYAHVTSVFNFAVLDRVIASSPCTASIRLPERSGDAVTILPTEVVWKLVNQVSDRFRNLLIVALGTGMRQGELFGLALDAVDLDRAEIKVRQQVIIDDHQPRLAPPKTKASVRTIPVSKEVLDAILDQVERYGLGPSGVIFHGRTGGLIRRSSFQKVWKRAVAGLDVPERSGLHLLRHFHASMLIHDGASVKVVQTRLGHASATETLDTYAHLWESDDDLTRNVTSAFFASMPDVADGEDDPEGGTVVAA